MKRIITISLLILLFSTICALACHYLLGYSLKKSLWVAYGAGGAMILFDLVIPYFRRERSIKKFNNKNHQTGSGSLTEGS